MKKFLLLSVAMILAVLCLGCSKSPDSSGSVQDTNQPGSGSNQAGTAETWICPKCGTGNSTRFCVSCGAMRPEDIVCPKCGSTWPAGTDILYCGNCGAQMDRSPEPANVSGKPEPAGARRELPEIIESITGGLPSHTILLYGYDGESYYIQELDAAYPVRDSFAAIEIPDHFWYDNREDNLHDTMDVTVTPVLKTTDGREHPQEPVTYTIQIPASPIRLITPATLYTETATSQVEIKVAVNPGSAVKINGEDISDTVSAGTGELTYNAFVQPIGDNRFDIEVRSPYCRRSTISITLHREPLDIPLDLQYENDGTTNRNTMKVKGTTVPGAMVEIITPYTDLDISEIDTRGVFTFNAVFDKIGNNTITVIASFPGKKPSLVDQVIYYVPSADQYTFKARPLGAAEYAELLANLDAWAARSKVYVIRGTVQYTVSDDPQQAVIYTSEDEKSQPVMVENCTGTRWEAGKTYRLYGDVYGTYNGMPWIKVRYTYEK